MGLKDLKSMEALIAGIASLVAVGAQYFALPGIIDIPANVSAMYQYLTTGVLIVVVIVLLLLSPELGRLSGWKQSLLVLAMVGAGFTAAMSLSTQISNNSFRTQCRDTEEVHILQPSEPSETLQTELTIAGSAKLGWCDHPRKELFRALVQQEAIPDATRAGLKLFFAQLLMAMGLITGAILLTVNNRTAS